jgi:putative ABC transport system ATP-binding protein
MDYDARTRALDCVNTTIEDGELVTIMGPSGSGKTTMLNILGGLEQPTEGSVIVGETELTKLNQVQLTTFRGDNLGFIFQQFHLVPYLTAMENVMLSQYFCGEVSEDDASWLLERVGLEHRLHHLPSQLSGGEQQRVAVARALANQPPILLADEPTGNLDQANGKIILDLLMELNQDGHTLIMVTHDPKIGELGERTIYLVDGKISNENDKNN